MGVGSGRVAVNNPPFRGGRPPSFKDTGHAACNVRTARPQDGRGQPPPCGGGCAEAGAEAQRVRLRPAMPPAMPKARGRLGRPVAHTKGQRTIGRSRGGLRSEIRPHRTTLIHYLEGTRGFKGLYRRAPRIGDA